jgi:putative SOS response-associated peptidase YedK
MQDRAPFAIDGLWENCRHPQSGEWIRTVAIITVPSNELVAQIHDRMPLILPKAACERWLGEEIDPHDLLVPFPAELMAIWPVSTRVNKPENDDALLLVWPRTLPRARQAVRAALCRLQSPFASRASCGLGQLQRAFVSAA